MIAAGTAPPNFRGNHNLHISISNKTRGATYRNKKYRVLFIRDAFYTKWPEHIYISGTTCQVCCAIKQVRGAAKQQGDDATARVSRSIQKGLQDAGDVSRREIRVRQLAQAEQRDTRLVVLLQLERAPREQRAHAPRLAQRVAVGVVQTRSPSCRTWWCRHGGSRR